MSERDLRELIRAVPKVELHLHIEGTLEPELMFELAGRNGVALRFDSVAALRQAYRFDDLQSFLDIYYEGAAVLRAESDFCDLALAYLSRVAGQNVQHVEIFFDPQTHTSRGIPIDTVVDGLLAGLEQGRERYGITWQLIPCFLRHLSVSDAMDTLSRLLPRKEHFVAVGLDSSEADFPPGPFEPVFERARRAGLRTVAHAGEEGPPAFIRAAVDRLGVSRIDHGVRCEEDPALVAWLAENRMPLTVCPLSNVKLRVFDTLADHNIKRLLDQGLCVTVNSDDPAYFGGYIEDNYLATAAALGLDRDDIGALAANAIDAAFIDEARREALHGALRSAMAT